MSTHQLAHVFLPSNFTATHAVRNTFVNSSISSARPCIHSSLKSMSDTQYCGLKCHAWKKLTELLASQRCRDAVNVWGVP